MQEYQDYPESDPLQHTQKMRKRFEKLIEHPRQGVRQADEPRAQALFETSAEVLTGLKTAFTHCEEKAEVAWRS